MSVLIPRSKAVTVPEAPTVDAENMLLAATRERPCCDGKSISPIENWGTKGRSTDDMAAVAAATALLLLLLLDQGDA